MKTAVFHYDVPFEWSHVICNCTDNETQRQVKAGKRWSNLSGGQPVAPCGRLPRYYLRKCEGCGDTYVKAFRHPHDCISHALCWECLEATTESVCTYYENHFHHFYCDGNPNGFEQQRIEPEPRFLEKRKPVKAEDLHFEEPKFDLDLGLLF